MLVPVASVRIGDALYDQQVTTLTLRRGRLPILDRLAVRFPAAVQFDAAVENDVVVELDGGEGAERVFTGRITGLHRAHRYLEIVAHGGTYRLAHYRPVLSLEAVTAGDAVRRLCDDAELDVSAAEDGPSLARYVVDGRSTALEEVVRLAHWSGAHAAIDGDGHLHVSATGGPGEDVALRHGRELSNVDGTEHASDPNSRTVVGEGGVAPSSPEALWVVPDFLSGSGSDPGPGARRRSIPEMRTREDAELAGAAWAARQKSREVPVRLRGWLLPALAPGGRIELHDVPDRLAVTECRIRQVIHRLGGTNGAHTEIWASARTEGATDLLGAAASALGGGVP